MLIHRAEAYFSQDRPDYWQHQTRDAERELNEAKDSLAAKQAATRPGDRPPATEAAMRVGKMEQRLRDCQLKQKQAKSWALEISFVMSLRIFKTSDNSCTCVFVM